MSRTGFRILIASSLGVAMGWCGAATLSAQEGAPRITSPYSAPVVPLPPKVEEKEVEAAVPKTRDDGDEPDTEQVDGRTVETIRERNARGQVRLLRQVAQDTEGNYVNHGVWKKWDDAGQLVAIGDYRDGERHGHWEQVVFAQYTPLLKHEPYREFAGPFLSEAAFEKGKLNGKWIISDADGRKISEVELANGIRHGVSTWFYPNGARYQEIHYVEGQLDGDIVRWSPKGVEVSRKTFKQGREVVVKTAKYDNGQLRSQFTTLSPTLVTETLDDWARTEFVKYQVSGESVKQGLSVQFHPNGQKSMEGSFQDNEPIGKHTWWHVNGQKSIEGAYRGGKPDGAWTWWHPAGPKSTQGEYAEGTPIGEWVWWTLEGKVVQRASLGTANSAPTVAQPENRLVPQLAKPESTSKALVPEPPVAGGSSRRR